MKSEALPFLVEEIFSNQGKLAQAKNFQYRSQQQAMAVAVAEALTERSHLIVEAETGVGKSLAYLIPSLLYALEKQRKAIVSTHTINLQEQLMAKEVPLIKKLFSNEIQVVLLKGRSHYLCPKRLERAMRQADDFFLEGDREELERLWKWSQETTEGTLSELEDAPSWKVWGQVCSEPHICTPRTCSPYGKCFYQQARKKAERAQLLIVNHSLFFTFLEDEKALSEQGKGYLFPNDFVIFDEAHQLEQVAARLLGIDLSQGSIRSFLQRLFHPKTGKGLLVAAGAKEARLCVQEVEKEVNPFFDQFENQLDFRRSREVRVTTPHLVDATIELPLRKLSRMLSEVAEEAKREDLRMELQESSRRAKILAEGIGEFLSLKKEDHVYWVEQRGLEGRMDLHLLSAPIDVAPYLRRLLFRPEQTCLMTSATLSIGAGRGKKSHSQLEGREGLKDSEGLGYFQNRIGGEVAQTLQVGSPFDYARQMKVYIPRQMPDPKDKSRYEIALGGWIRHFVEKSRGNAFALFTSYLSMRRMAQSLDSFFKDSPFKLLVQGGAIPRHRLLEKFKATKGAVLFGTDSFWQGVDVPGQALSNVMLTRLPFAVPDHPLVEAKLEYLKQQGRDPFREYSLPEAVLKFRQGIGRLIRTECDSGFVVILDNRILTKSYGKAFLAVLPSCPLEILEGDPASLLPC